MQDHTNYDHADYDHTEVSMVITKDRLIGDLLEENSDIAGALMQAGMHCIGCPSSQMETLEEACEVHGIDCDVLVSQLTEIFG